MHKSDDQVRECYWLAALAREQAMRDGDPLCREALFRIEDCWIGLAQSYQLIETLADFGGDILRPVRKRSPYDWMRTRLLAIALTGGRLSIPEAVVRRLRRPRAGG